MAKLPAGGPKTGRKGAPGTRRSLSPTDKLFLSCQREGTLLIRSKLSLERLVHRASKADHQGNSASSLNYKTFNGSSIFTPSFQFSAHGLCTRAVHSLYRIRGRRPHFGCHCLTGAVSARAFFTFDGAQLSKGRNTTAHQSIASFFCPSYPKKPFLEAGNGGYFPAMATFDLPGFGNLQKEGRGKDPENWEHYSKKGREEGGNSFSAIIRHVSVYFCCMLFSLL